MTAHPDETGPETKSEAARRRKAARVAGPTPESAHGKANGYNQYGCKCDRCLEWCRARSARRWAAKKDLAQYADPKETAAPKTREPIVWTLELIRELTK